MNRQQVRELIKARYPDLNKLSWREKWILNNKYGFNIPLARSCRVWKAIIQDNFMEHLRQVHNLENKFYNKAIIESYYNRHHDFDFCTIPKGRKIGDFEN